MNTKEFLEILHTAEKMKDTARHCTTTNRTRQGQAAFGGGCIMPPVQNLKTALLSGITKAPSQILKECCMPLGYLFVMECSIILILSFVDRIFAVPIG